VNLFASVYKKRLEFDKNIQDRGLGEVVFECEIYHLN
jgi:hypothetical protein